VPVISYDRLVTNAPVNYYISFDNVRVGQLQGQALASKLKQDGKATGPIVMINGAPTDNNAKLFKQGATGALNSANIKVLKSYDTPDWSPDKAQNEMQQAITAVGDNGFNGVYAANDGTRAVDLANGRKPPTSLVNKKTDNGQLQVPSVILTPVAVTKKNINDTVVKDGFWTTKQICTSAYASACKAAGLT
jgi:D-xylose transport system substrate-binding protein